MSSHALSDAVLAAACGFAIFMLAKKKSFAPDQHVSVNGALTGFVLMLLAALAGTLKYGFSESAWSRIHLMLGNAALFMAPALIGVAMILILSDKVWSKANWGHLVIGVCLLYEVSRWFGVADVYRDVQLALVLVTVSYLICRTPMLIASKTILLLSCTGFFIGALVVGNEGTMGSYLRLNLFRYLIALGCLMLGSGLYRLLREKKRFVAR